MRLSTIASAAVLALSTAAIAQVGQVPEEQKPSANVTAPDDIVRPESNTSTGDTASASVGPSTALVKSVADDAADSVGKQPPQQP